MERKEVESKLLKSIEYDATTKTLEVQFSKSGAVYQYTGIEPEIYQEMVASASLGSYFLKQIKPAFPAKRMDGRDSDATRKEEDDQTRPQSGWPDPQEAPDPEDLP